MADCTIGVISDTHGVLRPEAVVALGGSDLILHAGDIGASDILDRLRQIAPVVAVRGNVDRSPWYQDLRDREVAVCGGVHIYLLHSLADLDLDPAAAGFRAVVYGHSHKAAQATRKGVLYFNPGSAGPRRFTLPVSLGRLHIHEGAITGEVVTLG
jgi:hypothetical protein